MKNFLLVTFLMLRLSANAQKITLVKDIIPGDKGSNPTSLTPFNDKLYFFADDGTSGRQLYSYDGTNSTKAEFGPNPGKGLAMVPGDQNFQMGILFGNLYFIRDNGKTAMELFKYDGTHKPSLVAAIPGQYPSPDGSIPGGFLRYMDNLYFFNSSDIFRFDGSTLSSAKVSNAIIEKINFIGNEIYVITKQFSVYGYDTIYGYDYYAIAQFGEAMGPLPFPGKPNKPEGFTDIINGTVYYYSNGNSAVGSQLGYFSITYSGTIIGFTALSPNLPAGMVINAMAAYGNDIVFSGSSDGAYFQLWKYDITKHTAIELYGYPGFNFSPSNFFTFNGNLYFTAGDPIHGRELWVYDGTNAKMVYDLNPGPGSSNPKHLTGMNGALYMNANDGKTGDELFVLKQ